MSGIDVDISLIEARFRCRMVTFRHQLSGSSPQAKREIN